MRRPFLSYQYPTLSISITLMVSIICAHYFYPHISIKLTLICVSVCGSFACIFCFLKPAISPKMRKHRIIQNCQFFIIHLTLFILFFSYTTTYYHDSSKQDELHMTYLPEQLTTTDRCKLKSQSCLRLLKQEMRNYDIDNQNLAVISAMTMGDKSDLTPSTKNVFAITGASHTLAVSGLHIGIIFQVIFILLGGKRHRLYSVPISLILIWAYVFTIGLPASATRSATMISVYCFALIARRKQKNINTLSISFIILLLIHPPFLFDISFQMSFLAVGSILLFYHHIVEAFHPRHLLSRWAWSITSVSIAAQIGTFPIITYYFGRISCYSLLCNFIAIPAATLILYFTMLWTATLFISHIGIFTSVFHFLSRLIAKMLLFISQTTKEALSACSQLPGASLEDVKINTLQLYLIYTSIIAGYLLIRKLHRYHSHRSHLLASYRKHCSSQASQT